MENYKCIWDDKGYHSYFLETCEKVPREDRIYNINGTEFNYCPFCGYIIEMR